MIFTISFNQNSRLVGVVYQLLHTHKLKIGNEKKSKLSKNMYPPYLAIKEKDENIRTCTEQ